MLFETIGFFDEFIKFDDKKLQSNGFDPRVSSVEGWRVKPLSRESSVIPIIFKWTLVYVSLLLQNSGHTSTVPVKVEKLEWFLNDHRIS